MTYRRELGQVKEGGLVAIGELIGRVRELPSADITHINVVLTLQQNCVVELNQVVTWKDGFASIPSLDLNERIRPQSLLKAFKMDVKPWPHRVHLERDLRGPNRTLDYTIELLETAKQLCVRGYRVDSESTVRLEGRSLDFSRTPCFVDLSIINGVYVLCGIPPQPRHVDPLQNVKLGW